MKKITFFVIFLAFNSFLFATIWTVDKNPNNNANFTEIIDAIDAAIAGDTIYVAGHNNNYGSITLTKQVHLVGPGYFLDENPETNAWQVSAKLSSVTFNTGAEGSTITGFELPSYYIAVNCNDVTIKRNKIDYNSSINFALFVAQDLNGISIIQNYIKFTGNSSGAISVGSNTNCLILNNYIYSSLNYYAIKLLNNSSAQIFNNIIYGKVSIYNTVFYNNILRAGVFTSSSSDVSNNISDENQFGTGNNNQSNVDMTTVFLMEGSTDGMWQLKDGSPAIGAGFDGEDCGMFGGPAPYVLSGQPPIPAIYYINVPGTGNNVQGLPVTIKVKSHN